MLFGSSRDVHMGDLTKLIIVCPNVHAFIIIRLKGYFCGLGGFDSLMFPESIIFAPEKVKYVNHVCLQDPWELYRIGNSVPNRSGNFHMQTMN